MSCESINDTQKRLPLSRDSDWPDDVWIKCPTKLQIPTDWPHDVWIKCPTKLQIPRLTLILSHSCYYCVQWHPPSISKKFMKGRSLGTRLAAAMDSPKSTKLEGVLVYVYL